jgi:hypothetical protein
MHFSCNNCYIDGLTFNNTHIKAKETAVYLGNHINVKSHDKNILHCTNTFVRYFNSINKLFFKANTEVKYKLFKTQCMALYGCTLWDLSSKAVNYFYVQWRKCIRKLLNISDRTHSRYLAYICNDIPIEIQLYKRVVVFIRNLIKSDNKIVRTCISAAISGSQSVMCKNINHISNLLSIDKTVLLSTNFDVKKIFETYIKNIKITEDDKIAIGNIKDLLLIRYSQNTNLSFDEISYLLNYFCENKNP